MTNKQNSGNHGNSHQHQTAGKKGGEAVSQNREHMREIGRKGGESSGGSGSSKSHGK